MPHLKINKFCVNVKREKNIFHTAHKKKIVIFPVQFRNLTKNETNKNKKSHNFFITHKKIKILSSYINKLISIKYLYFDDGFNFTKNNNNKKESQKSIFICDEFQLVLVQWHLAVGYGQLIAKSAIEISYDFSENSIFFEK